MLSFGLQQLPMLLQRHREQQAGRTPARTCLHQKFSLRRLSSGSRRIRFEGVTYCLEHCLEPALLEALGRAQTGVERPSLRRLPLGLLLLSRGQIDAAQLRAALAAQQANGRGRIGEWLQALGFATELQVAAALARQWSCPLSRVNSVLARCATAPQVPATLLAGFSMIPLEYVHSTRTLFLAFSDKIHYPALYAIEKMMDCRTEACMALPSFVKTHIEMLRSGDNSEIVFDSVKDRGELGSIVRSYCTRISATDIRLARCGPYVWVRLWNDPRPAVDLLMNLPA